MVSPSQVRLTWSGARFWVQIHGLQLGLMNEKVGTILGEAIGDVNMEWCSFLGINTWSTIGVDE